MIYAVMGDIHANLDAFQTVIDDAKRQGAEKFLCVGDIVGYGAEPKSCLRLIRELNFVAVAGNHDNAAIGRLDISYFNYHAREAIEWTRQRISIENAKFLGSLPLVAEVDGLSIGHGTIHRPEQFGYIETVFAAQLSFQAMKTSIAFLGHSHVPITFMQNEEGDSVTYTQSMEVDLRQIPRAIINVGSVGQPRDDDPRSCYCIYDSEKKSAELRRIEYDIESAAAKIRRAGLPDVLAARLSVGR